MFKDKRKSDLIAIGLYVLAIILLGVGYFSLNMKTPAPKPNVPIIEMTTVRGTIKSIGVNLKHVASHILAMDDGNIVILDANGNDLTEYEGKRVDVEGKFEKRAYEKEIFIVNDVDLVDESENTTNPDANKTLLWKNFESADIGVSFKYREDFTVETANRSITVKMPIRVPETGKMVAEPEQVAIEPVTPQFDLIDFVVIYKNNMTLDEYVANLKDQSMQKSKISSDGTMAYKRTLSNGTVEFYAARENKMIYKISYTPSEKKFYDPNLNIFYEIITEMKFIPFSLKGPFTQ
ncbi:MAG: hypothetical protein UT33_C0013G0017 [Candidatus Peregrinibacteria bacterium GW2011_GWC2_39_14]|nr:MAG: hypothetical protein US92_C0007G0069 [Candidatus Peregrinibacteria bacterium GW2011_GWA2_38_36]KKR05165.1 MAG: hypothetical protein UT33_C0013G0017 [Candidatus Peregrinibacteria bacterium GW2011_GWC2_39_14]